MEKTKRIWASKEVHRLMKVVADENMESAINKVVDEFIGSDIGLEFNIKCGELTKQIEVSRDTWAKLTGLKVDLDYKTYNDLLLDAVLTYLIKKGICESCIMKLAYMDSEVSEDEQ